MSIVPRWKKPGIELKMKRVLRARRRGGVQWSFVFCAFGSGCHFLSPCCDSGVCRAPAYLCSKSHASAVSPFSKRRSGSEVFASWQGAGLERSEAYIGLDSKVSVVSVWPPHCFRWPRCQDIPDGSWRLFPSYIHVVPEKPRGGFSNHTLNVISSLIER